VRCRNAHSLLPTKARWWRRRWRPLPTELSNPPGPQEVSAADGDEEREDATMRTWPPRVSLPESGVTIADAIHSCLSFVGPSGWTDLPCSRLGSAVAGKPFEECHPQVACIRCREATGTTTCTRARPDKRFGSFTAVDGIDFDLYRGEAFGFLGPNGAASPRHADDRLRVAADSGSCIFGLDPVRDGRRSGPGSASCRRTTPSTSS